MAYIEVYSNEVLDMISLGKTTNEFNQSVGDYILVDVFPNNSNNKIASLSSKNLLLKYSDADNYY